MRLFEEIGGNFTRKRERKPIMTEKTGKEKNHFNPKRGVGGEGIKVSHLSGD